MEFLATLTTVIPEGTPETVVEDTIKREALRAAELGLWEAGTEEELRTAIATLPLHPWMTAVDVMSLTPHPNDPAGK